MIIFPHVMIQIYCKTHSPIWLTNAKKRLQDMKLWNEQGEAWNFHHKLQLMEAEEHYSSSNLDLAKESYENAIQLRYASFESKSSAAGIRQMLKVL